MSNEQRTPKFWHWDKDAEEIDSTTPDAAVEDYVDYLRMVELGEDPPTIPEYVTLYGYAPMAIQLPDPEWILDEVLERIEEEHGHPDRPRKTTDRMRAAASEFIDVVKEEWGESYWCEVVETHQVRVRDYVEVDDE